MQCHWSRLCVPHLHTVNGAGCHLGCCHLWWSWIQLVTCEIPVEHSSASLLLAAAGWRGRVARSLHLLGWQQLGSPLSIAACAQPRALTPSTSRDGITRHWLRGLSMQHTVMCGASWQKRLLLDLPHLDAFTGASDCCYFIYSRLGCCLVTGKVPVEQHASTPQGCC